MRYLPFFCLLLFFLSGIFQLSAQNTVSQNDLIESIIENIAAQNDENPDYTELLEDIQHLISHPVNLNTASAQDLEKLYLLNPSQIGNLLKYRENNGPILSIYELQLVAGFSAELLRKLEALITLKSPEKGNFNRKARTRQVLLLKTERNIQNEYSYSTTNSNARYLGNPWKYYTRYQLESQNLKLGFTAEKDKGEAFFAKDNKSGFDFYSATMEYKSKGIIQQINLGDYQVKFGQGVSIWSGLAGKKSAFTTKNAYQSQGIRPYHSTDENQFLRGVSLLLQPIKNSRFALFISQKKRDGSLQTDSTGNFISSIINTGYHRNRNEINKRKILQEHLIGSYFLLDLTSIELGFSFIQSAFDPEILANDAAYNYYIFHGSKNHNFSFTYKTNISSIYLFGEIARSKSGGIGILQGANIEIHPQLNFEMIYRKYDKDYQALYANAFAEQSKTQNEEGFYIGIDFHPFPKWNLKAYYDQFEFPWLRYTANAPGNGHEYFSEIDFNPKPNTNIYFRYKQESKPENDHSEIITQPVPIHKSQYRIHLSSKLDEHWEIRNRLEISRYKKESLKESGFLIYQDVIYHALKFPLTASVRYALFDTDSYQSRIYAYENDILYAYSIPAYYLKGSRFYFNLNLKIDRSLTLYTRFAQTKYANLDKIGSGSTKVAGNTKSDFKVQLRIKI
ncbi:ComEA family DNA-binding protein [Ancylomarina longa]|uniref:Helix-hairpin-helix domain-containing protein n=1 Tax=Ancylomarina longa TaxID=2487017 RepID=A0A434AY14_9BACT|nr:helix-hairpin-helix domain-containing protein [Ancylomarina longa]RUT79329.1 hypothetical protein DLK05_03660 [Ancylomarina longa]